MITRLKKRQQFLSLNQHGKAAGSKALVLQWLANEGGLADGTGALTPPLSRRGSKKDHENQDAGNQNQLRIGFTATRKIGNAVTRNRAKRRLRALAEQAFHPTKGKYQLETNVDLVLIARAETPLRPYNLLQGDLDYVLKKSGALGKAGNQQ